MMLYVLIVVTNAYNNGVTVSQHDYRGKDACEVAAIVVQEMAKDVKGWMTASNLQTRCVVK